MSSRAISGVTPGDHPLSQQSTRSDTSARCGRPGTDFAPFSGDFSQVNNYTNTSQTTTQPMAISGRLARKDSNDSMFGFSKSPMADELRCRKYSSSMLMLLTADSAISSKTRPPDAAL
jgi:hypothetical protein